MDLRKNVPKLAGNRKKKFFFRIDINKLTTALYNSFIIHIDAVFGFENRALVLEL